GFRNEIRNDRILRAAGLDHCGDHRLLIGRELQRADRLARLERERLARILFFTLRLFLFTPRRPFADDLQKLLLLLLQPLLAVGSARRLPGGGSGRETAAAAASTRARRARDRRALGAHI